MCQVGAAALCSQINAGAGGHTWGHKLSMPGAGSLLTADLIITSHASQVPATLGLARSCHVTPPGDTTHWRLETVYGTAACCWLAALRRAAPPAAWLLLASWPGLAAVQLYRRPGQVRQRRNVARQRRHRAGERTGLSWKWY